MSAGAEPSVRFVRSNDSGSLWNVSAKPGWSLEELDVLRKAIMKYGMGSWTAIVKAKLIPGKTPQQLNLQTQRLCGQQSLAEYRGLHVDISEIRKRNDSLKGDHVVRKGGMIINTGDNETKSERERKIAKNEELFGLSRKIWENMEIEKVKTSNTGMMSKVEAKNLKLEEYEVELEKYEKELAFLEELAKGGVTEFSTSYQRFMDDLRSKYEDSNSNSNSNASGPETSVATGDAEDENDHDKKVCYSCSCSK